MFSVSVPKPCHEPWQKMQATQRGAFCNACAKEVVDFTGMTDEEVKNYFINNIHQSTCGRFRSDQLSRASIEIPFNILQKRMAGWKKFLAIIMISFGTMLFGCDVKTGKSVTAAAKDDPPPPPPMVEADSFENSGPFLGVPYFEPDSTETTVLIREECFAHTTGMVPPELIAIQSDVDFTEVIPGGTKLDSLPKPNTNLPAAPKDSLVIPLKDSTAPKQKIPADTTTCGENITYSK